MYFALAECAGTHRTSLFFSKIFKVSGRLPKVLFCPKLFSRLSWPVSLFVYG